ncbi:hypothetical protein E2562_017611 [Oryza meyeriana var. granulata]|uniref:Uncharacterized protein n=1 Tax=Oryza meyeriana var. granulata TaxID=110450 RepID=A0A6G1BXZ5_9ORYZ|nr:hypothetical protein E2562_017611 [Oryza meyeriana var. granulata]
MPQPAVDCSRLAVGQRWTSPWHGPMDHEGITANSTCKLYDPAPAASLLTPPLVATTPAAVLHPDW